MTDTDTPRDASSDAAPAGPRLALAAAGITIAGLAAFGAVLLVAPREPEAPLVTGSIVEEPAPAESAALDTPDLDALAAARPSEPAPAPVAAVLPPPPAPFAAIRDSRTLRLTGAVASEAERAAILAFAQTRFVAEPVLDEMAVDAAALAAPEPVTQAALVALSRLAEGEARLAEGALVLEGRSLYRQVAGRVVAELGAQMPAGWQARLSLASPDAAAEPTIPPVPARARTAPVAASVVTPAVAGSPGASLPSADAAPAAAAEASAQVPPGAPLLESPLPPLPQRAALTDLDRHPLPPRR